VVSGSGRLRVLFVATRYWPAVGGVESFLRGLARALARDNDVTVLARRVDSVPATRLSDSLTGPPPFEAFEDEGVRVEPLVISDARRALLAPLASYVVPGLRRYAYGRARIPTARLFAHVVEPIIADRVRESDVVHVWGPDLLGLAGAYAAQKHARASLITPFAHENQYGTGPVDLLAYLTAERVIALLETDADVYRRLGVPGERVLVCGVGIDGVPRGRGEEIKRRHGIDGPLVVFLGVRRAYKGFDLLLEAAPLVGRQIENVTFAFLGPGGEIAADAGTARIVDAGFVSEEERAGWLEAASLVCLPSDAEIFPVSVLEAWSVKTPVVLSDIPTLAELVASSKGGIATPRTVDALAGALVSMLSDPAGARALGEAGHAFWQEHHTLDRVCAWHEEQYRTLLAREAVAA
jgi:glycosyltransferase involved in cell wall biosynthesis